MASGRNNYVWSNDRIRFIEENADKMVDEVLAEEMTKRFGHKFSVASVRQQRRGMGIRKENGRGICAIRKK